jgi:hypothetical protein
MIRRTCLSANKIGASYRFHQTVTLPPATGLNTQRIRFIDSVPAIQ